MYMYINILVNDYTDLFASVHVYVCAMCTSPDDRYRLADHRNNIIAFYVSAGADSMQGFQ